MDFECRASMWGMYVEWKVKHGRVAKIVRNLNIEVCEIVVLYVRMEDAREQSE